MVWKARRLYAVLLIIALLTLLAVACGGEAAPTPTATRIPTATPTVTTPPVATPTPTTRPVATPTPTPAAAATPTPTRAPAAGPPKIPHTLDGRADCLLCHTIGAAGVGAPGGMGMPANHQGYTKDICQACHSAG